MTAPGIRAACPRCVRLTGQIADAARMLQRVAPVSRQAPESAAALAARIADYTATMQAHLGAEHAPRLLLPADAFG